MTKIFKYRFLIARRVVQLSLLGLFMGANLWGWTILKGNYSSGILFDTVPLADPYAVLQILFTGFIAGTDLLIGAAVVLLLYGIVFGRIFCSWICPVNIIADTAIYVSRRLNIDSKLNLSRKTRYGALILSLLLSTILGVAAFEAISPVNILHRGVIFGIGSGWTIILAMFMFDLAVTKHGWCGHLCPLGAFYSLTGRFAILKVRHSKEKCTDCQKCFDVCHEPQVLDIINIKSGVLKSGECTNCARCIEVCDDNALSFTISNNLKKHKDEHI